MTVMVPTEFPSADEWQTIYLASPFPELMPLALGPFEPQNAATEHDIDAFARSVALRRLALELHNRVLDVARSYVFMEYFCAQGIPDERWSISPGRKGQSVEYFPDFESHHFVIKGWFDYYADTFYQKLFATWAVAGHILNQMFGLGIEEKRVDFHPAVKRLTRAREDLASSLEELVEDAAFQRARELRNDITHNEAPSSVGMTVTKGETESAQVFSLGMKSYATSTEIAQNSRVAVELLRRTLEAIPTKAT